MKDLLFGEYETFDEAVEGLKKKIKEGIKNPHRIPFKQHIPAFVDGAIPEQYVATSFEDLLERNKSKLSENQVFATDDTGSHLMVSSTIKKWWWVLGYVSGIDLRTRLPRFDEVYKGEENETDDNGNDL